MTKPYLKKFGLILDIFLLLVIIGIFGISLFTVVNLTPVYEASDGGSEILGVNTQVNIDKKIAIREISSGEPLKELEVVSLGDEYYSVRIKLDKHRRGQYFVQLVRVLNNTAKDEKVDIIPQKTDILSNNSSTFLLINNTKYRFDAEDTEAIPDFNVEANKSFDIGLYVNSETDVNFVSDLEFTVKVVN